MYKIVFLFVLIFLPFCTHASVRIVEIMYDLPGADAGREWIKIYNDGTESVDLTGWKFNDGSNHVLNAPPKNGGTGSMIFSPHGYAILASDAVQFVAEYTVSISVIDTVMNIGQQNDNVYTVALVLPDGSTGDTASYTTALGANGDGKSLQLINGVWQAASTTLDTMAQTTNDATTAGESPKESSAAVSESASIWSIDTNSISAFAGNDREVIVGADTLFSGKAIGTAGKPLEDARFVWSFGDGASIEGASVLHAFLYPGKYRIVLDVSSGKYAASDFLTVNALPADIIISRVASGADSFIELYNKTLRDLDLSWWRLKSGNLYFTFPKNTFLLSGAKIIFPFRITKLPIVNREEVSLLYPNGEVVVVYTEVEEAAPIARSRVSSSQSQISASLLQKTELTASNKDFLPVPQETKTTKKEAVLALAATLPAVKELPKASSYSPWLWGLGVLGITLTAVGGIVFSRKKDGEELTADDIKIVE
ncbi:MAG: lamin tail domain-containing protein [Parcubacteria group bacterium]|nr:lamin tail domain-containing protein [Parcubacteria group bacterium]